MYALQRLQRTISSLNTDNGRTPWEDGQRLDKYLEVPRSQISRLRPGLKNRTYIASSVFSERRDGHREGDLRLFHNIWTARHGVDC